MKFPQQLFTVQHFHARSAEGEGVGGVAPRPGLEQRALL